MDIQGAVMNSNVRGGDAGMVKRRYPKRIYPSELRALEKRLERKNRKLDRRLGIGGHRVRQVVR